MRGPLSKAVVVPELAPSADGVPDADGILVVCAVGADSSPSVYCSLCSPEPSSGNASSWNSAEMLTPRGRVLCEWMREEKDNHVNKQTVSQKNNS